MYSESNNRLNDDRTEKKEEKKTIEGNTFERGHHNTEQSERKKQQKGYK
jgi:hypothetical protein